MNAPQRKLLYVHGPREFSGRGPTQKRREQKKKKNEDVNVSINPRISTKNFDYFFLDVLLLSFYLSFSFSFFE